MEAPLESPCIQWCQLDHTRQVCLGCRRTLQEIASWSALSGEERGRILDQLPGRNPQHTGRFLPK